MGIVISNTPISALWVVMDARSQRYNKPRRRNSMGWLLVGICNLLLSLAGCHINPFLQPVTVEGLCGVARSEELSLGTTDEAAIQRWVQKRGLPLKAESYAVEDRVFTRYGGKVKGNYIWLWLLNGRLIHVARTDIRYGPTLVRVVDSLGPPSFVHAMVWKCETSCLYYVELHYPEKGVSVTAWHSGKLKSIGYERVLILREDFRVTDISCYIPGSMEDVLRNVLMQDTESLSWWMQRSNPWPGFGAEFRMEPLLR